MRRFFGSLPYLSVSLMRWTKSVSRKETRQPRGSRISLPQRFWRYQLKRSSRVVIGRTAGVPSVHAGGSGISDGRFSVNLTHLFWKVSSIIDGFRKVPGVRADFRSGPTGRWIDRGDADPGFYPGLFS